MTDDHVLFSVEDGIAYLILNRPAKPESPAVITPPTS